MRAVLFARGRAAISSKMGLVLRRSTARASLNACRRRRVSPADDPRGGRGVAAMRALLCVARHANDGTSRRRRDADDPRRRRSVAATRWLEMRVAATRLRPQAASAKGRATQKPNFLRYGPRIKTLGGLLESDIDKMISSGDWAGLEAACVGEAKKKGDKVGPFYSGVTAMELWGNTYSDQVVSSKTKAMLAEAEIVSQAREFLANLACKGNGTCLKAEGGLFGFGGKAPPKPSDRELAAFRGGAGYSIFA